MTALGNDKGSLYATMSRVTAILDEAVLSGALTPEERRAVAVIEQRALAELDERAYWQEVSARQMGLRRGHFEPKGLLGRDDKPIFPDTDE